MPKHLKVFVPGVFDLYNAGDILHFQKIKEQFGEDCEIILGFFDENDLVAHKIPTVMTSVQRTENLKHCKLVDGVISPCPWSIDQQFLSEFNINMVCNYQIKQDAIYYNEIFGYVKQIGKLREIKVATNVNSNQVIARILSNMDEYIYRNLSRGQSRHEMGISWFEEQKIKFKYAFKSFLKQLFDPCLRRMKEQ